MMINNETCSQPHVLPKRPISRGRKKSKGLKLSGPAVLGLFAGLVLVCALLYVGQKTYLMMMSYQLDALDKQIVEAQREQSFLALQIVQADSLDRVEQVATTQLGMVRPASRQFVVMDPV